MVNEYSIYLELKDEVADNDEIIAKLMKEKAQLQERITSQQEQSIKETSTIGVQFNYLIPSMGKSIIVCDWLCYTTDR